MCIVIDMVNAGKNEIIFNGELQVFRNLLIIFIRCTLVSRVSKYNQGRWNETYSSLVKKKKKNWLSIDRWDD